MRTNDVGSVRDAATPNHEHLKVSTPLNPFEDATPLNPFEDATPLNPFEDSTPLNPF